MSSKTELLGHLPASGHKDPLARGLKHSLTCRNQYLEMCVDCSVSPTEAGSLVVASGMLWDSNVFRDVLNIRDHKLVSAADA